MNIRKYRSAEEDWRRQREDGLRSEYSWMSLSALIWLDDLSFTLGGPQSSFRLSPYREIPHIGNLKYRPGQWIFIRPDGGELPLNDDMKGEPDYIHTEGLRFCLIRRSNATALRVWDSMSPRRSSAQVSWYDIDPEWRINARYVAEKGYLTVPTALGSNEREESKGFVEFSIEDRIYRLSALDGGPGRLFVVFKDASSGAGSETKSYPHARYITVSAPDSGGECTIDFNRATNPPCVWTDYATCPFTPRENHLDFPVRAGEAWVSGDKAEG